AKTEVKDYEIWIPIHRLYVESALTLGPVVFRTITGTLLDAWEEKKKGVGPESVAPVKEFFARQRSVLQATAAATIKIRAEQKKAVQVARESARKALALLRFFSPVNWSPKLRSYCTLLGSENIVKTTELFVEKDL